jgi:hypothetical protein
MAQFGTEDSGSVATAPPITCPQCGKPMTVKPGSARPLAADPDDGAVYLCEGCGVEAKRMR